MDSTEYRNLVKELSVQCDIGEDTPPNQCNYNAVIKRIAAFTKKLADVNASAGAGAGAGADEADDEHSNIKKFLDLIADMKCLNATKETPDHDGVEERATQTIYSFISRQAYPIPSVKYPTAVRHLELSIRSTLDFLVELTKHKPKLRAEVLEMSQRYPMISGLDIFHWSEVWQREYCQKVNTKSDKEVSRKAV